MTSDRRSGLRALVGDARIRALAVAELVSSLGSGIVGLSITYLTYSSTGSLLRTVLVTVAYTLPAALFGLAAGRLADRHSRRQLLIVLYSAKAVAYLGMGMMSFAGVLDANWLLVTSFVAGTLGALTFPAWEEYEKDLIPADQLAAVNALFSSGSSIAGLVGAVAGGVIVATVGPTAAFILDTLSYVPLIVVLIRLHPAEVVHRGRGHHAHELLHTVNTIRTNPPLARAIRNVAMLSLLAAPIVQLLPAIAKAVDPSSTTLGLVTGAFALGGTAVAWVITRLRAIFDRSEIVESSFFVCALALCSVAVAGLAARGTSLDLLLLASLLPLGLALSLAQSVIGAILQIHAPDEVEGEIFALYGIVYSVLAPVGAVVLGQLAGNIDVFGVIASIGALLLVYSVYLLVDIRHARARGELPPAPHHDVVRAHVGAWGTFFGLFAHHHPRTPLTVRQAASRDAGQARS